jgi:ribosome-binding protein aMBF1 (putative translation factor)
MCNRFTSRRHNSTTYTCDVCGKRTRETGHDESSVDLCAACYHSVTIDNTMSDNHHNFTPEQVAAFNDRQKAAEGNAKTMYALYMEVAAIAHA